MPINQSIWKISNGLELLEPDCLDSEKSLEDYIDQDVSILNENWLIIGRQVHTSFGKYIDLLAVDETGMIIIIELKKDKTPRDVVAQTIDYASWVEKLTSDRLAKIFERYTDTYKVNLKGESLDAVFHSKFKTSFTEVELNSAHQMVIVASALDESTERIVKYLSEKDIPINVVFFNVFKDKGSKLLSRAWFIDPEETKEKDYNVKETEPWNGEFYVSFGEGARRSWEDACKYGFISGGGGAWYSKTLFMLEPGNRVFVNIPQAGYVGVGAVEKSAVKVKEFLVKNDAGEEVSLQNVKTRASDMFNDADDDEKAEYLVKIKWIKTVPLKGAITKIGFFGNQNTVCKPSTPKWSYTVELLKKLLEV